MANSRFGKLAGAAVIGALSIVACGGGSTDNANSSMASGAAGASAGVGAEPGQAGGGGSAGEANEGGGASSAGAPGAGGASSAPNACERHHDDPPGPPIYVETSLGEGECDGITLGDVIEQVRQQRPDLDDVADLYSPDPERAGDGSFVYAFQRPDGGFALVFRRGDGDCPAGCTINDYWYFETGPGCAIDEVGSTHRGDDDECLQPDALPRWGIPRAALPEEVCGADLAPQDLRGVYEVVSCGLFEPCTLPEDMPTQGPLAAGLTLTIEQDADDLANGTVTIDGTGEPILDGLPLPATFERRKLSVRQQYSNLPAYCVEQWELRLDYDFEGFGVRELWFQQAATPDCESARDDTCFGSVYSDLGDAQLVR